MPSAVKVLQDHTVLRCRSLDRLYLNAYIPELQRPELVKRFLERDATRSPRRRCFGPGPRRS